MNRLIRPFLIGALAALAFFAPASVAYALWSTTSTATMTVSTAPPVSNFSLSCGSFTNPDKNGVANSYYSLGWATVPGATHYEIRSTNPPVTQLATAPTTFKVLRGDAGIYVISAYADGSLIGTSNSVNVTTSANSMACSVVTP